MTIITLQEADKIEITVLADNYVNLLLNDDAVVKRMRVKPPLSPLAEHGLAVLVTVYTQDYKHSVLMDTGISETCLNHNCELLPLSMAAVKGDVSHTVQDTGQIVLSHGHFDHVCGLPGFLKRIARKLPVIVHPGAFVPRRKKIGPDQYMDYPLINEELMTSAGALLSKRSGPSSIGKDTILVSGRIERTTDFEKGSFALEAKIDGQWIKDNFDDDQAIAVRLKNKGLVVMSGCAHAGIINTVEHCRRVTDSDKVYAVLGGFHLSGANPSVVDHTVSAMQDLKPDWVVPMHCTGWRETNSIAKAMPDRFLLNSVGTTYVF
ncbi:MAG: MBL fold metallo-hydrolase [Desulfobacteraceae bacterium]|nr:MBL fold metallo-hydrolase [Desulfobacteraceae bacterium]